jgi:hypothetical protein
MPCSGGSPRRACPARMCACSGRLATLQARSRKVPHWQDVCVSGDAAQCARFGGGYGDGPVQARHDGVVGAPRGRSGRPAPGKKRAARGGTGARRCGVPATSTWTCGSAGRHREAQAGAGRRGHRRPSWRRAPMAAAGGGRLCRFIFGFDGGPLCGKKIRVWSFLQNVSCS